jgi:hypothetical protein
MLWWLNDTLQECMYTNQKANPEGGWLKSYFVLTVILS